MLDVRITSTLLALILLVGNVWQHHLLVVEHERLLAERQSLTSHDPVELMGEAAFIHLWKNPPPIPRNGE